LAATAGPDRFAALIGAYCIAGHHAGLSNWRGERALSERLTKNLPALDSIWQQELAPEASDLFPAGFRWGADKTRAPFQLAMLGRMVFSCLVDADYSDTETFYAEAEGRSVDRSWPALAKIIDRLIARFDAHMKELEVAAGESPLGRLRADIRDHPRSK
jgi:CRISPR-associated endonuclease/helicase Cas3